MEWIQPGQADGDVGCGRCDVIVRLNPCICINSVLYFWKVFYLKFYLNACGNKVRKSGYPNVWGLGRLQVVNLSQRDMLRGREHGYGHKDFDAIIMLWMIIWTCRNTQRKDSNLFFFSSPIKKERDRGPCRAKQLLAIKQRTIRIITMNKTTPFPVWFFGLYDIIRFLPQIFAA